MNPLRFRGRRKKEGSYNSFFAIKELMILSKILTERSRTKKNYNQVLLDLDIVDEEWDAPMAPAPPLLHHTSLGSGEPLCEREVVGHRFWRTSTLVHRRYRLAHHHHLLQDLQTPGAAASRSPASD
jgi:hypothetical protein